MHIISRRRKRPTPTQSTCLDYYHDNEASKCAYNILCTLYIYIANQRRVHELVHLECLHELKEQGLTSFEKLSLKDNHELLNHLEHLGM
jgi:hypothetical protein